MKKKMTSLPKNPLSKPPLLDENSRGMIALELSMYLSWVEDTTLKSIMGIEFEKRIKLFLKKEKKIGRIKNFNNADIYHINLLAMTFDVAEIRKSRKKQNLDSRWPLMEKHIGLKK